MWLYYCPSLRYQIPRYCFFQCNPRSMAFIGRQDSIDGIPIQHAATMIISRKNYISYKPPLPRTSPLVQLVQGRSQYPCLVPQPRHHSAFHLSSTEVDLSPIRSRLEFAKSSKHPKILQCETSKHPNIQSQVSISATTNTRSVRDGGTHLQLSGHVHPIPDPDQG